MKPKTLLILGSALTLAACAENPTTTANTPPASTGGPIPYAAYATGRYSYVPADSPLRKWTTAKLQERRRDLYGMTPYDQNRNGIPVYKIHGAPLPQQEEIVRIEAELNRRYQAGDKSAELTRPIPGATHI